MSVPASMLPASERVRAIVDVQVLLPQLPRRLLQDLVRWEGCWEGWSILDLVATACHFY